MASQLSPTHELSPKASPGNSTSMEEGSGSGEDIDSYIEKEKKRRSAGARRQTCRCAKLALDYWNKHHKANGVLQYALVSPIVSSAFWEGNSWWFHANFTGRRKDDPAAKTKLFFAEVKGNVHAKKGHKVTKVSLLRPTDSGLYGCLACTKGICHPEEGGFHFGQRMCSIDGNVRQMVKERKAREKALASKTGELNLGSSTSTNN